MTDRPKRRMPSMKRLLEYRNIKEPHCQKCLVPMPVDHLERAHLIDRCYDGLDGAQNLAALCGWCHKQMPSFYNGDEDEAMRWLATPWEGPYHAMVRLSISRTKGITLEEAVSNYGCSNLHCYVVCLLRWWFNSDEYQQERLSAQYDRLCA